MRSGTPRRRVVRSWRPQRGLTGALLLVGLRGDVVLLARVRAAARATSSSSTSRTCSTSRGSSSRSCTRRRSCVLAGVPLVGFVVEQVLRLRRRAPPTRGRLEPGAALGRHAARDREARRASTSRPGDYVFLRIPAIASHEWHPFTISSAPERDALTFHVRSLGNWTAALRRRVETRRRRRAARRLRRRAVRLAERAHLRVAVRRAHRRRHRRDALRERPREPRAARATARASAPSKLAQGALLLAQPRLVLVRVVRASCSRSSSASTSAACSTSTSA